MFISPNSTIFRLPSYDPLSCWKPFPCPKRRGFSAAAPPCWCWLAPSHSQVSCCLMKSTLLHLRHSICSGESDFPSQDESAVLWPVWYIYQRGRVIFVNYFSISVIKTSRHKHVYCILPLFTSKLLQCHTKEDEWKLIKYIFDKIIFVWLCYFKCLLRTKATQINNKYTNIGE